MSSWTHEVSIYVGRVRQFSTTDWWVYITWVGLMLGLAATVGGLVAFGHVHAAQLPADAYMVPIGVAIFAAAIALDTIGHRTVYREAIAGGEALVHHITIFFGITSVLALCCGYTHPQAAFIPAAVLTFLSFFYAIIDEIMHWLRFLKQGSDRVEMWSHAFIFVGHSTMMLGWWRWFLAGYPGLAQTLAALAP